MVLIEKWYCKCVLVFIYAKYSNDFWRLDARRKACSRECSLCNMSICAWLLIYLCNNLITQLSRHEQKHVLHNMFQLIEPDFNWCEARTVRLLTPLNRKCFDACIYFTQFNTHTDTHLNIWTSSFFWFELHWQPCAFKLFPDFGSFFGLKSWFGKMPKCNSICSKM